MYRDGDRLFLTDQHDQPFAARYAGVEQVPLQHRIVLAARSLTHTDPAIPNTSGAIAGAALAKLGILDEVKGKTRHATLAVGGELVAKGEVELGFFNLSEIPKGVIVAGALPGPLQGYTVYEAAVLSKGSTDQAVTAFVKYLASAPAAAHWEAAKLEPATTYMPTRASR